MPSWLSFHPGPRYVLQQPQVMAAYFGQPYARSRAMCVLRRGAIRSQDARDRAIRVAEFGGMLASLKISATISALEDDALIM
jgi:hypothetical protein